MLIRESFAGVIDMPRTTISINFLTKTDQTMTKIDKTKTRSPIIGAYAEGGGLGSYLESGVATIRNFLTSTMCDLIDGAKSFAVTIGRLASVTTFRDRAAAA